MAFIGLVNRWCVKAALVAQQRSPTHFNRLFPFQTKPEDQRMAINPTVSPARV
jgi:hypothetical protein